MKIATTIRQRVRNTTQRRLGARMGCSVSSVNRLLRSVDQCAALLAALDLDLAD